MKPSCLYKQISKELAQKDMNIFNSAQRCRHEGSPKGFAGWFTGGTGNKKVVLTRVIIIDWKLLL